MAEQKERGLSAEEAGLLERIQQDSSVLDELAEDLSARTRRKRQLFFNSTHTLTSLFWSSMCEKLT